MLNLELYVTVKLRFNMAEGGMEMDEYLDELTGKDDDEETSFMNISNADSVSSICHLEETLPQYTGNDLVCQRELLNRSKVDTWLKEIDFITAGVLTPAPAIYTEFELDKDGRTLLLKVGFDKKGRIKVTNVRDPSQYLALSTLEKNVGVDFIRTYLFPDYRPARSGGVRRAVLASAREQVPAVPKNIGLNDLAQQATEVATVVKKR